MYRPISQVTTPIYLISLFQAQISNPPLTQSYLGRFTPEGLGFRLPHLKVKLYWNQTNANGTEWKTQFSKKVNHPKSWIIHTEKKFQIIFDDLFDF